MNQSIGSRDPPRTINKDIYFSLQLLSIAWFFRVSSQATCVPEKMEKIGNQAEKRSQKNRSNDSMSQFPKNFASIRELASSRISRGLEHSPNDENVTPRSKLWIQLNFAGLTGSAAGGGGRSGPRSPQFFGTLSRHAGEARQWRNWKELKTKRNKAKPRPSRGPVAL